MPLTRSCDSSAHTRQSIGCFRLNGALYWWDAAPSTGTLCTKTMEGRREREMWRIAKVKKDQRNMDA